MPTSAGIAFINMTVEERAAHREMMRKKTNARKQAARAARKANGHECARKRHRINTKKARTIFELLDMTSRKATSRGRDWDADWKPPNNCQPTIAPAGSPEKIEVLRQRLIDGEELFHDDDPWWDGLCQEASDWADVLRLPRHPTHRDIRRRDEVLQQASDE